MMCELYNEIQYFVDVRILKLHSRNKTEVTLLEFIIMILVGLITILLISWWLIPLRKMYKLAENTTFKCNKK